MPKSLFMNSSSSLLRAAALCALLAAAQSGKAQSEKSTSPLYVRLGAGYGFVHAGQTESGGAGLNGSEKLNGNSTTIERKPASFGSGFCMNLAGGYMITKHIGVELGAHAVLAPTKYTYSGIVPLTGGTRSFVREVKADLPVYLIPAVVLTTGDMIQFYGRAGLVLPLSDKLSVTETQTGTLPGQTTDVITLDVKNHFNIGLQGAGGIAYPLNEHLSIWGEISAISRNAYIKRSEITAYTQDGQDALPVFTTNQKVTEYDFESENEYPMPATQPNKAPTFSLPFSTVGFSVGVKYAF